LGIASINKAVVTVDTTKIKSALKRRRHKMIGEELFVKSAVLVPFLKDDTGSWNILFQVRSSLLNRQPGEICFPGGTLEGPAENPCQAARRETSEELGLELEEIDVWGQLGLIVTPSNMLLYSFVGQIPPLKELNPSPDEVDSVFSVPLEHLLTLEPETHYISIQPKPSADFPFDKIPGGRNYPWRTGVVQEVFYELDGRIIWGLTARILQHFLTLVRNT
jgi:coenzyme A diphosphatase NUDT7